jgi:hypothetical protein
MRVVLAVLGLLPPLLFACAPKPDRALFATPDDAAKALMQAFGAQDTMSSGSWSCAGPT